MNSKILIVIGTFFTAYEHIMTVDRFVVSTTVK